MKTLGKGWRTVVANVLTIGGALLAGPELAKHIDPHWIVAGVAAINIALRWLTTTPLGKAQP
ncbi:MAG TPA: hypothetical protein VMW48_11925 [Vicinamibacterales bacterium]|nr:hypothetical protein [Vicinamibacterales bacterium]